MAGGMKRCTKCGEEKAPSAFSKGQWQCKACQSLYHKLRRLANPALARKMTRRWRVKHPDRQRASQHASYLRHRLSRISYRSKVRALAAGIEITDDVQADTLLERDGEICYLCKLPMASREISIDHVIPVARGGAHTYANCALAHIACNKQKNDRIPSECPEFENPTKRFCPQCREVKPLVDFGKQGQRTHSWCLICSRRVRKQRESQRR